MLFKGVNEGDPPMDLVASHQRCLLGSVLRTTGPILELGVGWYSTPLLHELAVCLERTVYTIDNNMDWLAQFLPLKNRWHSVQQIGWWGELFDGTFEGLLPERFGVVFVDHGQPAEREYAIRGLIERADVFVLHDTEEKFAYGYSRVLPFFKHRWTDKCQKAWTTVCSNTLTVQDWFDKLPPVEPTQEVT